MGQGQGPFGQCCKDPPSQCHELLDGTSPNEVIVPALSVLPPSRRPVSKRDSNRLPQRDTTDTTRESTADIQFGDEADVHELVSPASSQQRVSTGCPCGGLPCDVRCCLPEQGNTCESHRDSALGLQQKARPSVEAAKMPETEKMRLIAGVSSQLPLPVLMPPPSLVSPPPRTMARPMRSRSPARGGRPLQPEPPAKTYGSEMQPLMQSAIRVYSPWIVVHEPRKLRTPRTAWYEHDAEASRVPSRWAEGVVDYSTLAASSDATPGRGAMQMRSMAREKDSRGGSLRRRPGYTPPVVWPDPLPEGLLANPFTPRASETEESSEEATVIQAVRAARAALEQLGAEVKYSVAPMTHLEIIARVQESCTATNATEVADEAAGPATPGTVGAAAITDARVAASAEAPYGGTTPRLPRWVTLRATADKGHCKCYGSPRHMNPRCISQAAGHDKRRGSVRHFIPSCFRPCLGFLGRKV